MEIKVGDYVTINGKYGTAALEGNKGTISDIEGRGVVEVTYKEPISGVYSNRVNYFSVDKIEDSEQSKEILLEVGWRYTSDWIVNSTTVSVEDTEDAYENACYKVLEELCESVDCESVDAEYIDICFVKEAVENA